MRISACLCVLALIATPALADAPDWTPGQQAVIDVIAGGPVGIETDFTSWEDKYHPDWTVWFVGKDSVREKLPHMQAVRDYMSGGARVIGYEAEFADVALLGNTAVARFNAVETIIEADGSERIVHYSGTDVLVKENDQWLIRTATVAFTD